MVKKSNTYDSKDYIGRREQLNGVYELEMTQGKATGMKVLHVFNEAGLSMLVMPDRGMDIAELKIRGKNVSFMSATGLVNSPYFVEEGIRGFLRNFNVGFLTTGGLSYMGAVAEDSRRGLHGVISNTPAERSCYDILDDEIVLTGFVREAEMFGPDLLLKRVIRVSTQENRIEIQDTVLNEGPMRQSVMMLYHTNFGYPFFSPETEIDMHPTESYYRDGEIAEDWNVFTQPEAEMEEVVYYHRFDSENDASILVRSPLTNLQMRLNYNPQVLPYLNQWKLQRRGNYVLGIEPATNTVNGIESAIADQTLTYIESGESRTYGVTYIFSEMEVKNSNEKITH